MQNIRGSAPPAWQTYVTKRGAEALHTRPHKEWVGNHWRYQGSLNTWKSFVDNITRVVHNTWTINHVLDRTKVLWSSYVQEMKCTPNPYGWWQHCRHQILFQLAFNFHEMEVEYCRPSTIDPNLLCFYSCWGTEKGFKWIINSMYEIA